MKTILPLLLSGLAFSTSIVFTHCTSSKEDDSTVIPVGGTNDGNNNIGSNSGGSSSNNSSNDDIRVITKYNRRIIQYAQVDKAGDYFRRMFIDSASAQAFLQTGVVPQSAIFYLETWFGDSQSTVYIRQKNNNEWQSNSFSPSSPNYQVAFDQSCAGCHFTARSTESVFTLPLLTKALNRKKVQVIECNQTSFNPCDLKTYKGN
ncbi:MAG: hypothetical protein U0Y10_19410 [Spirosomataceae bacterium]